jgi:hypothetical protein
MKAVFSTLFLGVLRGWVLNVCSVVVCLVRAWCVFDPPLDARLTAWLVGWSLID